jgi:benzylsuccinate CoA-transferase BbsE subunit
MPHIASDPQLAARSFWQDLTGSDGKRQRHCGSFAIVDQVRAPLRHFPGREVDIQGLLAEFGSGGHALASIDMAEERPIA